MQIVSIYLVQTAFTMSTACGHSLSLWDRAKKMIAVTDNNKNNNNNDTDLLLTWLTWCQVHYSVHDLQYDNNPIPISQMTRVKLRDTV